MKTLPIFLKKYFWEANFKDISIKKNDSYVISRILEHGDEKATRWLFENFKKSDIKKTLTEKRGMSRRSSNYWGLILNIPQKQMPCFQTQSKNKQQKTWSY